MINNLDKVILVNRNNQEIGVMEKIKAHKLGKLHRAFSIFIFNSKHELLLQKRAVSKYHSGGLWTNTCCSHPKPKEGLNLALERRLKEEMGVTCNLKKVFSFIYRKKLFNNLIEHEFDHVFFGFSDSNPVINKEEADDFKWIGFNELKKDLKNNKNKYTIWFQLLFKRIEFLWPK